MRLPEREHSVFAVLPLRILVQKGGELPVQKTAWDNYPDAFLIEHF